MNTYSAVVSQVVPIGFADLAEAANVLPGQEIIQGRRRLKIQDVIGAGFAGAIRFGGTLATSPLLPAVKVEVVVSPWSAGRSEVAVHPMTNLGQFDSLRSDRFVKAAWSVLPLVIDRLSAELPSEVPVSLELAA